MVSIGEMRIFSFFIYCSSGGFVYYVRSANLTSCLFMHDPTPCNLGNIVLLKYNVN